MTLKEGMKLWGETYQVDFEVAYGQYKDYTLVKFTQENYGVPPFAFHGFPSWFFASQDIQNGVNENDIGITIAIDPDGKNTYLTYYNKQVFDETELANCTSYGVFEDDTKCHFYQCIDDVSDPEEGKIYTFKEALKTFDIKLKDLKKAKYYTDTLKLYTIEDKE